MRAVPNLRVVPPDEALLISRHRHYELSIARALRDFERWSATPGANRQALAHAADWAGTRLGDIARENKNV